MHRVVRSIQQIARHEVEQRWNAALGVVKSVHGADGQSYHACTVELRESGLVLPKVPIAVGLIGFAALPRENDLVVVLFPGGDLHDPVVVGRLYSEDVTPPKHGPGELVLVLPGDETAEDKRLELRVSTPGDGTRSVDLKLGGKVEVSLTVDDQGLSLKAGDTSLVLRQTGASDGKAELVVGDAKVVLEQKGDITLEASGKLRLKAAQVEIAADASVKVTGQTIDMN